MGNTETLCISVLSRRVFLFPIMYFSNCFTYYVALSSTFSRKSRGDFMVELGSSKSVSLLMKP